MADFTVSNKKEILTIISAIAVSGCAGMEAARSADINEAVFRHGAQRKARAQSAHDMTVQHDRQDRHEQADRDRRCNCHHERDRKPRHRHHQRRQNVLFQRVQHGRVHEFRQNAQHQAAAHHIRQVRQQHDKQNDIHRVRHAHMLMLQKVHRPQPAGDEEHI